MMEFFVLGQVPGTDFQITFNVLLLGCALAGLFIVFKKHFFTRQPDLQLLIRQRRHLGWRGSEPQLEVRDNGLSIKF